MKRVRTPHYIAGLGDGNVKIATDQKDAARHDLGAHLRKREDDPRLAAQQHAAQLSSERFDLYFKDLRDANAVHRIGRHRYRATPWHLSAWSLVLTVIMLGALFLHILSDSQKSDRKLQRRKGMQVRKAKKKTDEWNDDEEEENVNSDKVIQSQSQDGGPTENKSETATPTLLYYPYHTPEPGLHVGIQHHRHRKSSLSQQNAGASFPQPPSAFPQSPSQQFVTGSPVPYGSKSPGSSRNRRPSVNLSMTGGASPIPEHSVTTAQHLYAPPQRTMMTPQQLPAASLSTTPDSERLLRTPRTPCDSSHVSPALSPSRPHERTPCHLLLSPGNDDVMLPVLGLPSPPPPLPKQSMASQRSRVTQETPRVGNQRRVIAEAPNMLIPTTSDHSSRSNASGGGTFSGSDAFKFASPPCLQTQNDALESDNSVPFPFIPNLQNRRQIAGPPKSVNIDDLHLYQMMESGNVSHWQDRIAEESRQLEDRVLSSFSSSHQEETPQLVLGEKDALSSGGSYEILSGDPRKSIQHKRTDLTSSTDASSSLLGAIDFDELKLIDVIGGGGFGQVWRAIWNGTPVAVKILTGSAQSRHMPKSVLQEFIAEINLLKGMRHPNICLYMGACLKPPNRAIITELAANGSLWDALRLPLCPPYTPCDGQTRQAWPLQLYTPDARHGAPPAPSSRLPPPLPPRDTWPWELVKRVACGAARGMAYLHKGKPPVLHRDLKVLN